MTLHRLTQVTIGVPNVTETTRYYLEFGLTPLEDGHLATREGGGQLRLVRSRLRRLVELGIGADDPDDIDRIEQRLSALDVPVQRAGSRLSAVEPVSGVRVVATIADRLDQTPPADVTHNAPGRTLRVGERSPAVARADSVRPRKLGHVVIGSTDYTATRRFFIEGLGFKISDHVEDHGTFMRCSTDHHNVLVMAAPVNFLHHTSWQVDDIDEVGRGAASMMARHPERHVWGLGRHYAGSNFFWYLKDPAGNFVSTAGEPNSGVLVDTWHFWRGNAPDMELLRTIPGDRLRNVQIADGSASPRAKTLIEDTLHHRSVPGEGELPLVSLLRVIAAKGGLRSVGPEVFSDELDALPVLDAARRCETGTAAIAGKAGLVLARQT